MFEIGKQYTVWMDDNDGNGIGRSVYRVVDFQSPLLKLSNPYSADLIINTNSPSFVRAQISTHQGESKGIIGTLDALDSDPPSAA